VRLIGAAVASRKRTGRKLWNFILIVILETPKLPLSNLQKFKLPTKCSQILKSELGMIRIVRRSLEGGVAHQEEQAEIIRIITRT